MHSTRDRVVRTGVLDPAAFGLARDRYRADFAGGLWEVAPVWAA